MNRSRPVISRYLDEETFKALKYGYLAVFKRPNLTCAEELEEVKNAIVKDIVPDEAVRNKRYLLRAGHGGNLDSMATGVLAVALCDGCKVLPSLLASSKRYTVTAKLGGATDTYNNKGRITAEAPYDHVTRPMLENALKEFVGEIWQKPPVFSALKIKGKRASDLASSGQHVNLIARPVMCHVVHCLSFDLPFFTLDVSCGQGFYVRSLVHDLAEAIGSCAHVTALVRTKHGPFTLQDCLLPEHYSHESITAAVIKARTNHPKLAQQLDQYWKTQQTNKSCCTPNNTENGGGGCMLAAMVQAAIGFTNGGNGVFT